MRRIVFVAAMLVVFSLLQSCERWWIVGLHNDSGDDVYCIATEYPDTVIGQKYARLIEAGQSTEIYYDADERERHNVKNLCYIYTFVSVDSVVKKGWHKVALERDFICRYEVYGRAFDRLGNNALTFPPTQKMLDAGVRVQYPKDYVRRPAAAANAGLK